MPGDCRIPVNAVMDAHRAHQAGWSLRALARLRYRQWGYASANSAHEGLRHALRTLELPVRDPIEASVLAHTIHGNCARDLARPDHPEHERFLAQHAHYYARAKRSRETSVR